MIRQLEQVNDFMGLMGQEMPEAPCIPSFDIQQLRFNLIEEENNELLTGAATNDIVEVADALCDSLYVVLGAFTAYGFKPDLVEELFNEVQRSNMSKACITISEAIETRNSLADKNKNELSDYVITQSGLYWIVARKSDMKVLKSINFKEPDLKSILIKHGVTI